MERRRKNNIIIGTLCSILVLMGVGYAILSTTLNIGATANITGDFDIHFTNIQRSSSTISDSSILSTIDAGTGITANTSSRAGTFTAILQKPTDYVIYTVSVANTGSIDGYLTFSFEDTNSNFDYYKDFYSVEFIRDDVNPAISTDILQPNASFSDPQVLVNTSGTRTYKIKVTFKESATSFPDPTHEINNQAVGNFECELNLTYSQQAPSNNNSPTQVSSEGWLVDNNGLVIQSPSNAIQNGTLTIPAVDQNGNHIVSINKSSFIPEHNVVCYETNLGNEYAIITDQTNYEKLSAFLAKIDGITVISNINQIPQGEEIEATEYYNLDTSVSVNDFTEDDYEMAILDITTLDISNAIYLTEISDFTFLEAPIEEIIFNNVLTTIGEEAFGYTSISSLTIPSSVVTIGAGAFEETGLTSLNLSNATSLTTIGDAAFFRNSLTTLDLRSASSLETIGEEAFLRNRIESLNMDGLTNLTTIGESAFSGNKLTTLSIPACIETIDYDAFSNNSLVTVDLSGATNLSTIDTSFCNQHDSNDNPTLVSINASNKTKAQYDTISGNKGWYEDQNTNFHITYSDYTCDYQYICTTN